jgi:cytochrome P450
VQARLLSDARRHRNAFLAFGGGPKICMGESFAWMEGPLLLATLAQRWRFEPLVQEVELDTTFTLRPAGGLTVRLEARR